MRRGLGGDPLIGSEGINLPLSRDDEARKRQLENLRPGAGAWRPGATPALKHGLRTRKPGPVVLDSIVREIEDALAGDLPLKDGEGNAPAPDRFAVELAAVALLRVRRCWTYLELHGDDDERGNLRPAFTELGKAVESAARMLDRLGMSPRARAALGVDLGRMQTFDLAQHWAAEESGGRDADAIGGTAEGDDAR